MISWYVYTMYTINIHQLRRIFLVFMQIYGRQHSVGELRPVSGHWQGWESKDATTSLAAIHLKETRAWLRIHMDQGLATVPIWEYWTSPYSSHYRPYTQWLGDIQWGHLMTHVDPRLVLDAAWMTSRWSSYDKFRCPEVLKELPGVSPDRTWQSSTPCETKANLNLAASKRIALKSIDPARYTAHHSIRKLHGQIFINIYIY